MKRIFFLIPLVAFLMTSQRLLAQREQDSLALVAIYNATDGAGWTSNTNWLGTEPITTWYGVTVSGNRVSALDLANNNLSGQLPQAIGNLTSLQNLTLEGNSLSGSIPAETGNLTSLTALILTDNQFTGAVPQSINNLTSLTNLRLAGNRLEDLPALTLTNVNHIHVQGNRLTFEDIEPNVNVARINMVYTNQDSIGVDSEVMLLVGETFDVDVVCGGANNLYQWYKDGVLIPGATQNEFSIGSVELADSGVYYCEITNTVATKLTIFSRLTTLVVSTTTRVDDLNAAGRIRVYPNPAIQNFQVDLTGFKVEQGSRIRIVSMRGAIVQEFKAESDVFEIGTLSWPGSGIYYLQIIDRRGLVRVSKPIVIQ